MNESGRCKSAGMKKYKILPIPKCNKAFYAATTSTFFLFLFSLFIYSTFLTFVSKELSTKFKFILSYFFRYIINTTYNNNNNTIFSTILLGLSFRFCFLEIFIISLACQCNCNDIYWFDSFQSLQLQECT